MKALIAAVCAVDKDWKGVHRHGNHWGGGFRSNFFYI